MQLQFPSTRGLIAAFLALMTSSSAYAGNDPRSGEADPRSGEAVDRILQKAYTTLARYSAVGGQQISFRISDPRLIERKDFGRELWLDLVTMPGGDMVDMAREVRLHNDVTEAVFYRPKWALSKESFLDTKEGLTLVGMTVEAVLSTLSVERPEFQQATGMTSYGVEVALDGRSRSYQAAILWFDDAHGSNARISFLDHITQGVEEAVLEKPFRPRPRSDLFVAKTNNTCYAGGQKTTWAKNTSDSNGHRDGAHWAGALVDFLCVCNGDCSQTCEPYFDSKECSDYGNTSICHKMATNSALSITSSADASASGSGGLSCAAGLGCELKTCAFCICSPGVSIKISGVTVSFASSGTPDWRGNLDFTHTCAACATAPVNLEPAPGPLDQELPGPIGGGGGGSVGECCYWLTTCYVDWMGWYTCTPSTCALRGC
jgi:hypothetical protein